MNQKHRAQRSRGKTRRWRLDRTFLKKTPNFLLDSPSLWPRLLTVGTVVLGTICLLCLRLWYLQAIEGEHFRALSESNRLRLKQTEALRGIIYDRKGRVLVDNRPSFDVVLVPEDTPDIETTLNSLTLYLPGGQELANGVSSRRLRRPSYEGVVVKRDVDWSTLAAVESHKLDIPGVSVEVHPKRRYPSNGFAAHLLGYVGEISPEELILFSDYHMGEVIGKFGAEKRWEKYLRGRNGFQHIEVDSVGRRLRILEEIGAQSGFNLILTLDWDMQDAAEKAMAGKEGALVILDPRDGAVLAMVSRPAFDPNIFARGIRPEEWQELVTSSYYPLTNRVIQGQYPPGSTFKVVLAAAALAEGMVNPSTRFFCRGGLRFGGRFFHCWKKGGHGMVDLHRALVQSCNVYFYQIGQQLGIDAIANYARRFGLGQLTKITLDHEKVGVIPEAAWKEKIFGVPWGARETLSVAIGQGYVSVTPLQMATLTAAVANGGIVYRPYLVRRVESVEGEVVEEYHPEVNLTAGIDQEILNLVRLAMRDVVNSPPGTGKKSRLSNVLVAGKTGTAQTVAGLKEDETELPRQFRDHAWFIAFAPFADPEIVVVCLVEHAGQGGGAVAAPVVRQVLERYFASTRGKKDVQQEAPLAF